jgi:hypothetical protein
MKTVKTPGTVAFVFAALLCAAASSRAQTPAPSPAQARDAAPAAEPDISITAHVTARELRFEKVPNPTVEFPGKPERQTAWEADRENLPDEVRPGVTYRNIGVRLRITSVFADIERIVAEALGEVPTNDAPTVSTPPPRVSDTATTPGATAPTRPAPASPAEANAPKPRTRPRGGNRR